LDFTFLGDPDQVDRWTDGAFLNLERRTMRDRQSECGQEQCTRRGMIDAWPVFVPQMREFGPLLFFRWQSSIGPRLESLDDGVLALEADSALRKRQPRQFEALCSPSIDCVSKNGDPSHVHSGDRIVITRDRHPRHDATWDPPDEFGSRHAGEMSSEAACQLLGKFLSLAHD
jgi:hypothetical protein